MGVSSEGAFVEVLYFAGLRDAVGCRQERLPLPDGSVLTVETLLHLVEAAHPELRGRLAKVRVAVNESFAASTAIVPPGAVVAIVPPVQGG